MVTTHIMLTTVIKPLAALAKCLPEYLMHIGMRFTFTASGLMTIVSIMCDVTVLTPCTHLSPRQRRRNDFNIAGANIL